MLDNRVDAEVALLDVSALTISRLEYGDTARVHHPRVLQSVTPKLLLRSFHKDTNRRARYRKAQRFFDQEYIQRELRAYHISMDTILIPESIMHFYSYARYRLLCSRRIHTRRTKRSQEFARPFSAETHVWS
jgi:hypothetical protein